MRRKIDFLKKMFSLMDCRQDILLFLRDDGLISDDDMQRLLHEDHNYHPIKIASLIDDLSTKGSLQLASYEWSILPKEHMCLTLVSETDKKEFIYSV